MVSPAWGGGTPESSTEVRGNSRVLSRCSPCSSGSPPWSASFCAPKRTLPIEQGGQESGSGAGPAGTTAEEREKGGIYPQLTATQADMLRDNGITQIPDGRWMRTTNTLEGGYLMTPVNIARDASVRESLARASARKMVPLFCRPLTSSLDLIRPARARLRRIMVPLSRLRNIKKNELRISRSIVRVFSRP